VSGDLFRGFQGFRIFAGIKVGDTKLTIGIGAVFVHKVANPTGCGKKLRRQFLGKENLDVDDIIEVAYHIFGRTCYRILFPLGEIDPRKPFDGQVIEIAGKTGTAELGSRKQFVNSWVIGFFPYESPKYAFAVVMEKGPSSNLVGATYIMRQLFDWMAINTPEYLKNE